MTGTGAADGETIAWEAPDADVWELEAAHGNRIMPVTLRDEFEGAFAEGFRHTFATLGIPLSHIEIRHVNGWPYTSVFLHDVPRKAGAPPPAFVLKVLTRVHPGFRRRTKIARQAIAERRPQRLVDDWIAERQAWIDRILRLQQRDLDDLDDAALGEHLREVAAVTVEGARRHFELVSACIPLGEWLHHSARWGLDPARSRAAVMHGVPVHAEARQRLQRIADELGESAPSDLDQVRAHGAGAAAALDDYVAHHGWWATEDTVEAARVIDLPQLVVGSIRAQRRSPATDATAPEQLLAELRASIPAANHDTFDRLARDAHRAHTMLEDNSGILAGWTLGLAGHAIRTCARRLADAGRIRDPAHIWALQLADIVALLEGRSPLGPDEVGQRHAEWRALALLHPPATLNGTPSPPPDPNVFPAPVAQLVTGMMTFLGDKFNDAEVVSGIGTTTVVGRAVVANDAAEAIERIEPGDILVTSATTPAYNSILPVVAGLIVSSGGPSCHAAIMARELGIPALVGHRDALTIADGATIELDPRQATVRTLSGPPT
jgi:pyruvate,water dikinase